MIAEPSMDEVWIEDLPAQARRALAIGRDLCTCDDSYHALWPTLRAAKVSYSLRADEPRLAALMTPFIRDGARVMIGGAADPGLLCAIGRIYSPSIPAITVIDRCKAPLESIRQFAAGKSLTCRTLNLDLLEFEDSEEWDQIVLHYTPNFIGLPMHDRLFRRLSSTLAPGGVLVCVAMTSTTIAGASPADLESVFFAYSLQSLRESALADIARNADFEPMLQRYARGWSLRRTGLRTHQSLCEALHAAGLRILTETTTARKPRFAGGHAIVDTNAIIVADRPT